MTPASFVCPCCPLHCDDLDAAQLVALGPQRGAQSVEPTAEPGVVGSTTEPGAGQVQSSSLNCPLLVRRIGPAIAHNATAEPASGATLRLARDWVAQAGSILITGQIIDLETARAVCRFVERTGARLSPGGAGEASAAEAAYREAFTRDGIFATTLGDAAAPRSSVILIGDPRECWPRLRQRLAAAGEILLWESTDRLAERLAQLRRSLRGAAAEIPAGDRDLTSSAELCGRAVSLVFVVVPGSVAAAEASAFWSSMIGLLADLNRQRRAALLRFDDSLTLRSVSAWSGDRQALSPLGEPWATADLVIDFVPWGDSDDSADSPAARRWTASGAASQSATAAVQPRLRRRITIGRSVQQGAGPVQDSGAVHGSGAVQDSGAAQSGAAAGDLERCYLPASGAGIGRRGVVLRGDGSVALPLRPLTATGLPSAAELLEQLIGR